MKVLRTIKSKTQASVACLRAPSDPPTSFGPLRQGFRDPYDCE
jgi:hypothetical protein